MNSSAASFDGNNHNWKSFTGAANAKSFKSKRIPLLPIEYDLNNALTFGLKYFHLTSEEPTYFVVAQRLHSVCKTCFGEGFHVNEEGFFTGCPRKCTPTRRFTFGNRYQIQKQLGSGTFSTTFQAIDKFSCEKELQVAIKVMNKNYMYIGINEIQILQYLKQKDLKQHFPVVRFLDKFLWKDEFLCVVEEYLECEALDSPLVPFSLQNASQTFGNAVNFSAYLSQKLLIAQSIARFRKVAFQACKFLVFLQANQLIHADLKVDNIMFVRKQRNIPFSLDSGSPLSIRFIDFGNAVHFDCVSGYFDEFEIQSFAYRAPEVLLGCLFGEKIDVWSMGCCLFAIWTGVELFGAVEDEKALCKAFIDLFGKFVPLPPNEQIAQQQQEIDDSFFFCQGKFWSRYVKYFEKAPTIPIYQNLAKILNSSGLSEEGIDLVCKMLHPNPSLRITPKDTILHPFFEDFVDPILYCIA